MCRWQIKIAHLTEGDNETKEEKIVWRADGTKRMDGIFRYEEERLEVYSESTLCRIGCCGNGAFPSGGTAPQMDCGTLIRASQLRHCALDHGSQIGR